jgi:hypothetical protein
MISVTPFEYVPAGRELCLPESINGATELVEMADPHNPDKPRVKLLTRIQALGPL